MRTALLPLLLFASSLFLSVNCNPLLSTSLASEPPPPPLNTVLPAKGKMEVKWEPFRDIFENIIRPIGGEHDVAAMLEQVKEEDINELEGTLLDKAKDDPEFVEQILTHLIHIRERYIKLRKDWQKTIEDRDKTAKIFKARIVDSRSDPSSPLLPANGHPVQFTQSFTPNTGLTNVAPVLNTNPPIPTPPPTPTRTVLTTVIVPEQQQHFTVSSQTLPNSVPPHFDEEEVEEDSGSFLGALPSHPSTPSDFFFVPNHVIDPHVQPEQIIFDTAIPQFASRGSPPAPPPHIAARRATPVPTTLLTTTTQRPTRPWHFSSRATTTIRPETVPWWWTKKSTKAVTTTTTTTTTPSTTTSQSEKAGIRYDHENNRTVYRYFWKPNAEDDTVIPEMIDENGNAHSAVTVEVTEQETTTPVEEVTVQEEFLEEEESSPPPPTTRPTTPRPSPTTTSPRPTQFATVPEFAPRQPVIIRDPRFGLQPREVLPTVQNGPQRFPTATGSRLFSAAKVVPHVAQDYEEIPLDEHPLEPWAPTERPTTISTTRAVPTTTTTETTTTTTTTTPEPTTTTEEPIPEVPTVPEFASQVEDISQFTDEFSETSVDERDLVNILNKEEEQRGVTEAKWFNGPDTSFDKDQQHLSGSPKRFIPEFPGEVDPETFPEGEITDEPKRITFTGPPTVFTRPTTLLSTTIEESAVPPTSPASSFTEETAEEFEEATVAGVDEREETTVATAEQIEDTTETLVGDDQILEETAEDLAAAFADFERVISTQATEGPTEPSTELPTELATEATTTTETPTTTSQQSQPVIRQGVRAPSVVVWGRRPPKQPSTMVNLDRSPPSIRPTKKPRKKTTKVPDEISLLDELLQETQTEQATTLRPISELQSELAREAKIRNFFDEQPDPHADARVRGRTPGRKIRTKKEMNRRVDTSHFVIRALNRDEHLTHEEARIALGLPGRATRPHSRRPTTVSTSSPPIEDDSIQLLVQDLQREFLTRGFEEKTFATCNAINCSFENYDTCMYESSLDELIFGDDEFRRRRKRSAFDSFVVRAWNNWGGANGDPALGNIALASGRLPSDAFSQGNNERFAGTQVNPNQMALMSTQIDSTESLRILFDVWEGTRGVQLRVCCDSFCPFETELGVKKGSRNWLQREVICPKGTRQLSFECTNTGKFRGACGVDNIRMDKC